MPALPEEKKIGAFLQVSLSDEAGRGGVIPH